MRSFLIYTPCTQALIATEKVEHKVLLITRWSPKFGAAAERAKDEKILCVGSFRYSHSFFLREPIANFDLFQL